MAEEDPQLWPRTVKNRIMSVDAGHELANALCSLPRIEDPYTILAGGLQFTTLDLKYAYNQVPGDDDSKDTSTINTTNGLLRYNHQPLGVSVAPGIFQCIIDTRIKDIPRVCACLDDILITGPSPGAHIATLSEVLILLVTAGFVLKKRNVYILAESAEHLDFKVSIPFKVQWRPFTMPRPLRMHQPWANSSVLSTSTANL